MLKCLHICWVIGFLLGYGAAAQSTEQSIGHEPHWAVYVSVGGGASFLGGLSDNIYQDGHANVQLGAMVERTFSQRFSWVAGLELEQMTYAFDGEPLLGAGESLDWQQAPDGMKYTRLQQRNLGLLAQMRYYFNENTGKQDRNIYLQGGIRASLNGTTNFLSRQLDEANSLSLAEEARPVLWAGELMVGFKGDFFSGFDLLNASSLGLIYQISPIFHDTPSPMRPLHLSWRFVF